MLYDLIIQILLNVLLITLKDNLFMCNVYILRLVTFNKENFHAKY